MALLSAWGPTHVISLDVVHAPLRVKLGNRIVVRLARRFARIHAVHRGGPGARVVPVGNILSMSVRAQNGQLPLHRLARDAAHDVNPELQSLAVDIICERFEPLAARRRRKPVRGGKQPPVIVHRHFQIAFVVAIRDRMRIVPVEVHDHVLPAQAREMLVHIIGVSFHLFLRHVAAITVIAVPAHGRGRSEIGGMAELRSPGFGGSQQPNYNYQTRDYSPGKAFWQKHWRSHLLSARTVHRTKPVDNQCPINRLRVARMGQTTRPLFLHQHLMWVPGQPGQSVRRPSLKLRSEDCSPVCLI